MATNPRIEELRKRVEKEPGSRLFAQLAEELRKAGELADAVRVARDGLKQHSAYPSARMTLGRALLELEDLPAARVEFEAVLRAAPDNLLAGRFLADCLEGMGDYAGAVERTRQTLALAPGDAALEARLAELEARRVKGPEAAAADAETPIPLVGDSEDAFELEGASGAASTAAGGPSPPATAGTGEPTRRAGEAAEPEEAPIPLVEASEEFELESVREAGPAGPGAGRATAEKAGPGAEAEEAPIPLVDVEETFELESAHDAAPTHIGRGEAEAERERPASEADEEPIPLVEAAPGFEVEAAYEAAPTRIETGEEPAREIHEDLEARPDRLERAPSLGEERLDDRAEPGDEVESGAPPLASVTLAELYVRQGLVAQAEAVYEQLLERDPRNESLRSRLRALRKPQATAGARWPPPEAAPSAARRAAPPADPRERRRVALERAIRRLERLREAVRRP